MSKKSATQLKVFKECPRKWAFQYRLGLRPPQHPSAALGTAIHKVAEDWLRTGLPFDMTQEPGRIFSAGLKFLPEPSPSLKLEYKIDTDDFRGYIDVFAPDASPRPLVIDHKSCSSFYWSLSESQLLHDEQAIIYGYAAMRETGADAVDLRWIYYRTQGDAEAQQKSATVYKSDIDIKYKNLVKLSEEIDRTPEDPLQVPGNMSACNSFGGCAFKNMCHGGNAGRKTVSELLEKLKAMQAAKSTTKQASVLPPEATRADVKVQPELPPPAPVSTKTTRPSRIGYTLYVNCMPMTGASDLSTWLHGISENVAREAGKDHYRMVEYGGGSALLAVAVGRAIGDGALIGEVFVDTYNRTASDVLDVLMTHADKVVRGIR